MILFQKKVHNFFASAHSEDKVSISTKNPQPQITICAINFFFMWEQWSVGLKDIWLPALTPNNWKTVQLKPVPIKTAGDSSKNGKDTFGAFIVEQSNSLMDLSVTVTWNRISHSEVLTLHIISTLFFLNNWGIWLN